MLDEADMLRSAVLGMLEELEDAFDGRHVDTSYELRYMVEDAFDAFLEHPSIDKFEEFDVVIDICRDEAQRIIDEEDGK